MFLLHILAFCDPSLFVYLDVKLPRTGCGQVLDFPQGRVPCPLLRREVKGRGRVGVEWEEGRKCKFFEWKNKFKKDKKSN